MSMVYLVAAKSKDPRTKIGAVLVKDKHIISTGFNGFPIGVEDKLERYLDRETKYKFVAHAEANSIFTAARFGIATNNSTLYTQGIVCNECCKSIIQGGVTQVVVHKLWPNLIHSPAWIESINISKIMLKEAGIKIKWLNKQLNMTGFLDGKLIKV